MEELGLGDVDDIEGKIQQWIITDRAVSACIKTESCVKHSKSYLRLFTLWFLWECAGVG